MNTNNDLIDAYLLGRMSNEEKKSFESKLSEDNLLKEEFDFTSNLREELKDRNDKLRLIKKIKNDQKRHLRSIISVTSIAAAIILGVFILAPEFNSFSPNIDMRYYESYRSVGDITAIAKLVNEKLYHEALSAIELEQKELDEELKIIHEQNSSSDETERIEYETKLVNRDNYELTWLKINAILGLGKKKEAIEILEHYVVIDGSHQEEANKIYRKIK